MKSHDKAFVISHQCKALKTILFHSRTFRTNSHSDLPVPPHMKVSGTFTANLHAGLLSGPTTHETRAPQAQAVFAYKASGYAALHADSS